ncbi:MAG: hypothetical protein WA996_11315 [Candidatus Promineifilaceae bacterium]
MSEEFSDDFSEDMSEDISEDISSDISEDFSNDISEDFSNGFSDDFADDFVVEEEEEIEGGRSFLLWAGALLLIFIAISACMLVYLLARDDGKSALTDGEMRSTAISEQNMTTEANNALVTQTVEAIKASETEQAVQRELDAQEATRQAEEAAEEEMAAATANAESQLADAEATAEAAVQTRDAAEVTEEATEAAPEATATPEGETGEGESGEPGTGGPGTATPLPTTAASTGDGTLPATGTSALSVAILGLGLIAVLVIARRLRSL